MKKFLKCFWVCILELGLTICMVICTINSSGRCEAIASFVAGMAFIQFVEHLIYGIRDYYYDNIEEDDDEAKTISINVESPYIRTWCIEQALKSSQVGCVVEIAKGIENYVTNADKSE
jgi:hypothetical protein